MIGELYRDDTKDKLFTQKVSDSINAYEKKLNKKAKVVYVNDNDYNTANKPKFTIPVIPKSYMLPNHFWVGEEKK